MKLPQLIIASLALGVHASSGAIVSLTATGATPASAVLAGSVNLFRSIISGAGVNNGVGGGPHADGRREINWDAAGLDAFDVPATMPLNFFRSTSPRGIEFTTGAGSMILSGRAGSGSPDTRFDTVNPAYSAAFQPFSASRLAGLSGTNAVDAYFFLPGFSGAVSTVSAFGSIFEDVDLAGSTRIEAFDINNVLLGSVDVPVNNNGISFAGLYADAGEQIFRVRIVAGTGGLGPNDDPANGVDMVAMDDFIYSEPQVVPEPSSMLVMAGSLLALMARRRRA